MPVKPIRNIAIMAHADAGKTTITEQFLFLGGQTRQPGRVDQGTAQTDFLPVEQERGISVMSAHTSLQWKQTRINLIDTPGHVDFSSDVERIMRIPDGVILVISAVEGVQAHTETLWRALMERQIPVIFFINKIDRVGADCDAVLKAIRKDLIISPLALQEIAGEGDPEPSVTSLWNPENIPEQLLEHVVATDETLLGRFLDGTILPFHAQVSWINRSGSFPYICSKPGYCLMPAKLMCASLTKGLNTGNRSPCTR